MIFDSLNLHNVFKLFIKIIRVSVRLFSIESSRKNNLQTAKLLSRPHFRFVRIIHNKKKTSSEIQIGSF